MNENTSKQTDCKKIIEHLKAGRSITKIQALELFGCFSLSSRISDLRKQGYRIITSYEKGRGKHWAKYRLLDTTGAKR